MRVIDHAHKRALIRHLREEAQHCETNEKPIGPRAGSQPERGQKSVALRPWEPIKAIEYGRAQLMKRGKRKLHLRLDSGRPQNSHIRRRGDRVLEERGFPDPGLAFQNQRCAAPSSSPIEERIKHGALGSPTVQDQPPGS